MSLKIHIQWLTGGIPVILFVLPPAGGWLACKAALDYEAATGPLSAVTRTIIWGT